MHTLHLKDQGLHLKGQERAMSSNGNSRGDGNGNGFMNPAIPHIPLAQVYWRAKQRGQRSLIGRIGSARLVIVETHESSRGEPVWEVFLGRGPHASERAETMARELEDERAAR